MAIETPGGVKVRRNPEALATSRWEKGDSENKNEKKRIPKRKQQGSVSRPSFDSETTDLLGKIAVSVCLPGVNDGSPGQKRTPFLVPKLECRWKILDLSMVFFSIVPESKKGSLWSFTIYYSIIALWDTSVIFCFPSCYAECVYLCHRTKSDSQFFHSARLAAS